MGLDHNKKQTKSSLISWCLYDAGNSAFGTVIITFIFSVYFARGVVGDEIQGSALWSYAIAASGLVVALCGPVMGAVADHYGARKIWLGWLSVICVVATFFMYLVVPDSGLGNVALALGLLMIANIGFELALVFANAMLPHIAPPAMIGRLSGWSWGIGYLGGLICLVLALVGLVGLGDMEPLLALPQEQSAHIRATAPLTALWFAVLTVPLLLWTHDSGRSGLSLRQSVILGLKQLVTSFREVRAQKNIWLFLVASAIYRDGLNTLFAVGGLYAAGTFGMDFTEILIFAIGLNLTAGIGAILFGFVDDYIGSKRTIMISLAGLVLTGTFSLFIYDKMIFIALAMVLGIFIGPAQSASRTLAARLSSSETVTQTFGLYAFTGKSVAFFGPLFYGLATMAFDSQRAGMAIIILFWLIGMVVLRLVEEKR